MTITTFEQHLEQLGHQVERKFVGPVSTNVPGDPGWEFWCDGQLVATGSAIGGLEQAVGEWWETKCGR